MKTIKLRNDGKEVIAFQIAGLPGHAPKEYKVGPGDTCEVPVGYFKNNAPMPSFIERRGKGHLVPANKAIPGPEDKCIVDPKKEKKEEPKKEKKEEPKKEKREEPKKKGKKK